MELEPDQRSASVRSARSLVSLGMLCSRIGSVIGGVAWLLATTAENAVAKRSAPGPVEPVTIHGVTYSAPPDAMGFVVATKGSSGSELWRARIYAIPFDPALERDVQDVFITSLSARGGGLLVTNERGERFLLDLQTRKVTRKSE